MNNYFVKLATVGVVSLGIGGILVGCGSETKAPAPNQMDTMSPDMKAMYKDKMGTSGKAPTGNVK